MEQSYKDTMIELQDLIERLATEQKCIVKSISIEWNIVGRLSGEASATIVYMDIASTQTRGRK